MINSVRASLLFVILAGCMLSGQTQECPKTVSEVEERTLTEDIQKKYDVPASAAVTLAKVSPLTGTCYRQLTFQTKTPLGTRDLSMYLSHDGRFLSSEVLDTHVDPVEEARRQNQAVMEGLTKGNIPTLGRQDARVTIVEFSDFQCPYCAKFDEISHSWARSAAEGAACAQLQSGPAFWGLHDHLFQNQKSITAENVKQKLLDYAASDHSLDLKAFKSCLDNQLSLGLVFQDTNLASTYDIAGTPTIFINGRRLSGVKDVKELRELIQRAELGSPVRTNAATAGLSTDLDKTDKITPR